MLGFDTMRIQERQFLIKESKFYKDLVKDLSSDNDFSDILKREIVEMRFGVDQTRLFDGKYVQWGVLKVKSSPGQTQSDEVKNRQSQSTSEQKLSADNNELIEFLFVLNDIEVEFPHLNLERKTAFSIEQQREGQETTIQKLKQAYFVEAVETLG